MCWELYNRLNVERCSARFYIRNIIRNFEAMKKFYCLLMYVLLVAGCTTEKSEIPDVSEEGGIHWTGSNQGSSTPEDTYKNELVKIESQPNGIWLWSTHLDQWVADDCKVLKDMKKLGYEHILLNYTAFEDSAKETNTKKLIAAADKEGVIVHAWIQCFYDGNWVNPIEDLGGGKGRYKQELFDQVIAKANRYIEKFGVKGIHLDYIRFSGVGKNSGYKNNYENGVTAAGAVTEFCRQLNANLDAGHPGTIISAAMMPDKNGAGLYGQNPAHMSKYLDILMPMVYRYYANAVYDEAWMKSMCKYFTDAARCYVWAGIQTYEHIPGTENVKGLSTDRISSDASVIRSTRCDGLVLFRYALGEYPDFTGFWIGR